jgi:anti-anti-sigma factor
MTARFDTTVRREGETGVLELAGELDGDAASAMTDAYAEASSGADRILLDFGPMTFMNSSGIALIVELLARARREGKPVHAVGLSDHYRQIFEITRLSDFVTIHTDEDSAVA